VSARAIAMGALLVGIASCARPAPQEAQRPPTAQRDDTRGARRARALERLRADVARDPRDAAALYAIAELEERRHHEGAALDALDALDAIGWDVPLDDTAFPSLASLPRYRAIAARIAPRAAHVATSAPSFTVAERGLIPEGIAFDPRDGTFFVSSIAHRKIVAVDASGRARDLVRERQDGLYGTQGMKVDLARDLLWVASTDEASGESGVFAFDPRTGALRRRALLRAPHEMNDLAFDERGSVFVTDSVGGGVFLIVPASDTLLPYLDAGTFLYPNGIALSDATARIFVAHIEGVAIVDRTTKRIHPLAHDANVSLGGIDGLALHEHALYAVQNGIGLPRVVRFDLDDAMDRVVRMTILETEAPAFEVPTTGVVANGAFHFIANSQLDVANGPPEKMREVIVLKVPL
jgi:sugar lactone lactonase YvrE